jgi:phosphoribosyl-AMP cyclohydrolase
VTATATGEAIHWEAHELVPAVVQDAGTLQVLMMGFMNREAYDLTRETGRVHFYSRSRQALWRKGESSGNELIVDDLRVNCEQNSVLVLASPIGPTCHDGYQSCYYRRIEPDGALTTILGQMADPAQIYATHPADDEDPTQLWYRAYEYLRDNDHSAESGTSRRLRDHDEPLTQRLADELRELAGVLDGSHSHHGLVGDVLLEGSQTIYWTALIAIRAGIPWSALRPDRALQTAEVDLSRETTSGMLRAEAAAWEADSKPNPATLPSRCHATLALIAQACQSAGVEPAAILRRDLDDLRTRSYLAPIFDNV